MSGGTHSISYRAPIPILHYHILPVSFHRQIGVVNPPCSTPSPPTCLNIPAGIASRPA
jgi:hypothetical protein